MSHERHRRQPPPGDNGALRRTVLSVLIREGLDIIIREIWRGGLW
jgi:hypothetical protein